MAINKGESVKEQVELILKEQLGDIITEQARIANENLSSSQLKQKIDAAMRKVPGASQTLRDAEKVDKEIDKMNKEIEKFKKLSF